MARFGKKADLESQKSTREVECLVSVTDDSCQINEETGRPTCWYVEAQRLQDEVDEADAIAGKADSSPYITNKKEYYKDISGTKKVKTSHVEQISVFGMEKIKEAAANEFDTMKKVFDAATGEELAHYSAGGDAQLYSKVKHRLRGTRKTCVLLCAKAERDLGKGRAV